MKAPPTFPTHHIFEQATPLFLACACGKTEFALSLLRAGASPHLLAKRSSDGRLITPLNEAALHSNTIGGGELCQALIDAGATVGLGRSPLYWKDQMKPEVVKMLKGASIIKMFYSNVDNFNHYWASGGLLMT